MMIIKNELLVYKTSNFKYPNIN